VLHARARRPSRRAFSLPAFFHVVLDGRTATETDGEVVSAASD
jgi:hypothetical protein